MDKISRSQAVEQNRLRYYTGKPCSRGHICERYVCNWGCVECDNANNQHFRTNNPEYAHQHYVDNKDTYTNQLKLHRANNPEYYTEYNKLRYRRHKHQHNNQVKQWRDSNRSNVLAACAKRRTLQLQRTPGWADDGAIKEVYKRRESISQITGIVHHVDHIIPLKGKTVCGLHVEYNLQVIARGANLEKGNKLVDEE